MINNLSIGEKKYIIEGINDGIRYDGRGLNDYRSISIENDIFPHLNGSSRIKIADETDIVCSVKVEVLEISNNNNNNSNDNNNLIEINVEFSSSYNLKIEERRLTDYGNLIAKELQSIYKESNSIDMKSLCIIPNKFYWIIYIDICILKLDGIAIDACSIASLVALQCTKIPKVDICVEDDFTISGDLSEATKLDITNLPIITSISKIGKHRLFDVTNDERACSSYIISIATNFRGACCGILKHLCGSINIKELNDLLIEANVAGQSIFKKIEEYYASLDLINKTELANIYTDVPPLRIGFLR